MGASQFLGMGTGGFNSLSRVQFGSTSLSGANLNAPSYHGPQIGVGETQSPLPLKQSTFGTNAQMMAWRKHSVMPLTTNTEGSTFSFHESPSATTPTSVSAYTMHEPHMEEEQY